MPIYLLAPVVIEALKKTGVFESLSEGLISFEKALNRKLDTNDVECYTVGYTQGIKTILEQMEMATR